MNAPQLEPEVRKLFEKMFDKALKAIEEAKWKVAMLEAILLGGPEDTVPEGDNEPTPRHP